MDIGIKIAWAKVLEEALLAKTKKNVEVAADIIFDAFELKRITNQQALFCVNKLIVG